MTPSKHYLDNLIRKLKTGNLRSKHLNAISENLGQLDVYDLSNINQSLHLKFLNRLLTKRVFNFSFSIDPKQIEKKDSILSKIIRKLDFIIYNYQDEFLEFGTKSFAFGYPLLIKRDPLKPEKVLKAPLLIWYLNIERDLSKSLTWKLSRNENHPVVFNELLHSQLKSSDKIDLDTILEHLEKDIIDETTLLNICKGVLEKIGAAPMNQDTEVKILPCPNKNSIQKITEYAPCIRWSGIFGLFKTPKQSIIKDLELLKTFSFKKENREEKDSCFEEIYATVKIDPSQEHVLNSLKTHDQILIQGPPGTGKSQTLTAIISNALYNQKSCLIVCEKKTALDVIFKNLKTINLDQLCIVIEDTNKDRTDVVRHVRSILEEKEITGFKNYRFKEIKERVSNLKHSINNQLNKTNIVFFGDDNWIDLVCRFKNIAHKPDETLVKIIISLFKLNFEEYKSLLKIIEEVKENFSPFGLQQNPFKNINHSTLNKIEEDKKALKDFIKNTKDQYTVLNKLVPNIKVGLLEFGEKFFKTNRSERIKTFLFSLVNSKYKRLKSLREEFIYDYQILKTKEGNYFDIHLPDLDNLDSINQLISTLQSQLKECEKIQKNKRALKPYLEWNAFLNTLSKKHQKVFNIITKYNLEFWEPHIKSSYLYTVIQNYADKNNLRNCLEKDIDELLSLEEEMRTLLSSKTLNTWSNKQTQTLSKRSIKFIKSLYNFRKNKVYGRRNTLRAIVNKDPLLFKTTFPVLLTNPTVASAILPLQDNLYDVIIFDEASQLRLEDTYASLLRGKKKIISGDKHQMPPSNYFQSSVSLDFKEELSNDLAIDNFLSDSESLLEYASDLNFKPVFLDFHYRSKHPSLIKFSNNAFYGQRLSPMPPSIKHNTSPFKFYQVDGIYKKDGTNIEEAKAIIESLKMIELKQNEKIPSIGIATFNVKQRNLVWSLLINEVQKSTLFSQKISKLIQSGLFVKNLENIQGDERDIIMISTTYGLTEDGKFRQNFGPISRKKGYKLLNVIITRAKEYIEIYTSIPTNYYENYIDAIENKGSSKGFFYAYLAYAKAIVNNNQEKARQILQLLMLNGKEKHTANTKGSMSMFMQEVFKIISSLKDVKIQPFYTHGGFTIDFAIFRNNTLIGAIETDNKKEYRKKEAYRWLLFSKTTLKASHLPIYRVYSYKWWLDWNKESKELLQFVNRLNNYLSKS